MAEGHHASDSGARPKPAIIFGAVVVVLLAAAGFLLLRRGDGGLGGDGDATPKLEMKTTKVLVVPTRANAKAKNLTGKGQPAAVAASTVMNTLYSQAFLDPGNWKSGSYDGVWELFDDSASSQAQTSVETLTAGTKAGDTYDSIRPQPATLKVKVLLDDHDRPFSAVAIVAFEADAALQLGGQDTLVSNGQFFLENVDGGWKIVSFQVHRADQDRTAPASASGGTSP